MFLCYMDESGTPDVPGNTSHYVLAGVSIPVTEWRNCDTQIQSIKQRYDLQDEELHVAWILRRYLEQSKIPGFDSLGREQRKYEVHRFRTAELLRLQREGKRSQYQQTRKNFQKTQSYVHLSLVERQFFINEVATAISGWEFATLFAECVDKIHFDPIRIANTIDEQAFEQVVSRFEQYLQVTSKNLPTSSAGLIIHDNNETVAKKHTALMKKFHIGGTQWARLKCVIETPLFVNSELTSMVQVADLCCYAIRRYLENNETDLFDLVFKRADKIGKNLVGVRHFTHRSCTCKICASHRIGVTT